MYVAIRHWHALREGRANWVFEDPWIDCYETAVERNLNLIDAVRDLQDRCLCMLEPVPDEPDTPFYQSYAPWLNLEDDVRFWEDLEQDWSDFDLPDDWAEQMTHLKTLAHLKGHSELVM